MKIKIAFSRMRFVNKPNGSFDWGKLNNSFKNVEMEPIDICNAIYMGYAYTAWMEGKRNKENFICAQHVAVDLDTQDFRSSFDCLIDNPFVRNYGAILHTTPTHTPHAPKARVIFLLDEPITNLLGYELAMETIYAQFDGADKACIDGARFFFGNGKLSETHDTGGIWITSENICFPIKDLRTYARQYSAQKKHERESMPPSQSAPRPADTPPDLEEIENKLLTIDSYLLPYDWWLKTVAGLKHEFGDTAFWLAKRWSDRPGKEEFTERKWQTLGNHDRPATIATVYKVIQDYAPA